MEAAHDRPEDLIIQYESSYKRLDSCDSADSSVSESSSGVDVGPRIVSTDLKDHDPLVTVIVDPKSDPKYSLPFHDQIQKSSNAECSLKLDVLAYLERASELQNEHTIQVVKRNKTSYNSKYKKDSLTLSSLSVLEHSKSKNQDVFNAEYSVQTNDKLSCSLPDVHYTASEYKTSLILYC